MKWTTEKPTREGWYFVRFPNAIPEVVYLNVGDEPDEIYWNDGDSPNDNPDGTQYAGPIPKPEEDRHEMDN